MHNHHDQKAPSPVTAAEFFTRFAHFTPLADQQKRPARHHKTYRPNRPNLDWTTIGIYPTGGLFVIDIDEPDTPLTVLYTRLHEHGFPTTTLTIRTPSGGYHLYYRLADGYDLNVASNNTILNLPFKGDLRAGTDGYVLAPGTQTTTGFYLPVRNGHTNHIHTLSPTQTAAIMGRIAVRAHRLGKPDHVTYHGTPVTPNPALPYDQPITTPPPTITTTSHVNPTQDWSGYPKTPALNAPHYGPTPILGDQNGFLLPTVATMQTWSRFIPKTRRNTWYRHATHPARQAYHLHTTTWHPETLTFAETAATPIGQALRIADRHTATFHPLPAGTGALNYIRTQATPPTYRPFIRPTTCQCGQRGCTNPDCIPTTHQPRPRFTSNVPLAGQDHTTFINRIRKHLRLPNRTIHPNGITNTHTGKRRPYHELRATVFNLLPPQTPHTHIATIIKALGLDYDWHNGANTRMSEHTLLNDIRHLATNPTGTRARYPINPGTYATGRTPKPVYDQRITKTLDQLVTTHRKAFATSTNFAGHSYAQALHIPTCLTRLERHLFTTPLNTPARVQRAQQTANKSAWRNYYLAARILTDVLDPLIQAGMHHCMLNNQFLHTQLDTYYGDDPDLIDTLRRADDTVKPFTIDHVKQAKRALIAAGIIEISRHQYCLIIDGEVKQGTAFFTPTSQVIDHVASRELRRAYVLANEYQYTRDLRCNPDRTLVYTSRCALTPNQPVCTTRKSRAGQLARGPQSITRAYCETGYRGDGHDLPALWLTTHAPKPRPTHQLPQVDTGPPGVVAAT